MEKRKVYSDLTSEDVVIIKNDLEKYMKGELKMKDIYEMRNISASLGNILITKLVEEKKEQHIKNK